MTPVICCTSSVADTGVHTLGADVGQVFLAGRYSRIYSNNLGYDFRYSYGASDAFDVEAQIGHSSHDASDVGSDGKLSLWHYTVGIKANMGYFDSLIPFGMVGLGFYNPRIDLSATESVSKLAFGFHAGAGADLLLAGRVTIGIGLTFREIFGASARYRNNEDIDMAGSFYTFLLRLGVRLN